MYLLNKKGKKGKRNGKAKGRKERKIGKREKDLRGPELTIEKKYPNKKKKKDREMVIGVSLIV